MDYSIVIPVFNREDLTRQCLETLRPTLAGAGEGEVIVVDNGSAPATDAVLRAFPWVRVIRNERNLGFAAACNQGARAARGSYLVHLNNDTKGLDGWLARMLRRFEEPGLGIVGARLLFPNDTLQHAGVLLAPIRFGPEGIGPYHFLWGAPGNTPGAMEATDFEAVTGACLVTPRDLYLELGGFDEAFWNGYEDVDYCLKVRARGLRVAYEPQAVLYHFESQSGVQRKRRLMHNIAELSARWAQRVAPDHNRYANRLRFVRREQFLNYQRSFFATAIPPATVFVHGTRPADPKAFLARVRGGRLAPERVVWAAAGPAPAGAVAAGGDALAAARAETEVRADRFVVFVDTRSELEPGWLPELVDTVEFARDIVAATVVPEAARSEWAPLAADAQCTLVALRLIPQHLRIDTAFETLDGAVADWIARAVALGRSVRPAQRPAARIASPQPDATFRARRGTEIAAFLRPDAERLERLSERPHAETFASIVMLSWNAPEYTQLAVASIRERTRTPYEIIIIDNGSGPETLERLAALQDVRVIYNERNTGFAHGCNQGIAAARGTHVVLLNNDVVVTDGWLEALLDAQRRDPAIGVSAPRSNSVAGHQQLYDAVYPDIPAMHLYARERAERYRGRMYHTDRVIGFCMCIARAVIDEVGGIDPRYGVGNFEDDDYCMRVRAAGYEIAVCEDAFIHHFGSVSFKANKVDYGAQMQRNWGIFAERWGLPREYPTNGYQPAVAIARGYERDRHYVALPSPAEGSPPSPTARENARVYEVAVLATIADENEWSRAARFVTNYARALGTEDPAVLAIAATGRLDAATLARRVERALAKAGVDPGASPDIDVADVNDVAAWRERFAGARCFALSESVDLAGVAVIADRSPSGLARLLGERSAT